MAKWQYAQISAHMRISTLTAKPIHWPFNGLPRHTGAESNFVYPATDSLKTFGKQKTRPRWGLVLQRGNLVIARLFFHIALESNRRIALQIAAELIVLARQDRI